MLADLSGERNGSAILEVRADDLDPDRHPVSRAADRDDRRWEGRDTCEADPAAEPPVGAPVAVHLERAIRLLVVVVRNRTSWCRRDEADVPVAEEARPLRAYLRAALVRAQPRAVRLHGAARPPRLVGVERRIERPGELDLCGERVVVESEREDRIDELL